MILHTSVHRQAEFTAEMENLRCKQTFGNLIECPNF